MNPAARIVLAIVLGAAACSEAREASPVERPRATASPQRERFVPFGRAVARLAPHIDVPVVLPRPGDYGGWVADLRYVDWRRYRGRRVGTLVVRKDDEILWIHYGHATPDGCGGRATAVETDVSGQPGLVWTTRGREWSQIVWPVRPRGHTGRYGLAGTFTPGEIVRLAESMDVPDGRALPDEGC